MAATQVKTDDTEIPIIKEFMAEYNTQGDIGWNQSYYRRLAKYVAGQCEEHVRSRYDAIITYRAKTPQSLQRKLVDRHGRKAYQSEHEIRSDIVDFAGVRIALYFPHHKAKVDKFIEDSYHIDPNDKIVHPVEESRIQSQATTEPNENTDGDPRNSQYSRRFSGYQATHYRVRFKEGGRPNKFQPGDKIEIQVMSVLQSAWSEVEHNILYKQLKGSPSFPEKMMLDGLNGLVSVGELYLEQLNRVFEERIGSLQDRQAQFANEYELGAFLTVKMRRQLGGSNESTIFRDDEFDISCVELLQKFLRLKDVAANSKQELDAKLANFNLKAEEEEELKNPYSTKPNISLMIMKQLYRSSNKLQDMAARYKPQSDAEYCKVLVSAIISLDELFAPSNFWEKQLMGEVGSYDSLKPQLEGLKWLMESQDPKNLLIGDQQMLEEKKDQDVLLLLWKWLDKHESPCIKFVFSISKLGVLRDFPQDIELMERLCAWCEHGSLFSHLADQEKRLKVESDREAESDTVVESGKKRPRMLPWF
ncbi:RelA/SpoT [Lasiodiplodia theobromae]|nr:RelA/SpoT [Lasiodiplodia theobromae]